MNQEARLYHIFKIRIGKKYYKTERIYTDDEFDHVMDAVGWNMPFNLSAYHFMSSSPPVCKNPVMNALPLIDCSVDSLLTGQVPHCVNLRDKQQKCLREVSRKWRGFVVAKDELSNGIYGKLLPLDEEHTLVSKLDPLPITLQTARKYVDKYHRHNVAPQGHKFSIGLISPLEEEPVGVVIASIPKSRVQAQDRYTLEINRCCAKPYYENACSKLYSLAIRAGKSMGYHRFITYTLEEEPGSSLKAVGFRPDGIVAASPTGWASPSRPRKKPSRYPEGRKIRWVLTV